MIFDPLYFLLLAPALLLAAWAQWRTRSAFTAGHQVLSIRGLTGAEAAAEVMHAAGVSGVAIEPVQDGQDARSVLAAAAAVEAQSEHPLARAITRKAREDGIALAPIADFQALPGKGASARSSDRGSRSAWC